MAKEGKGGGGGEKKIGWEEGERKERVCPSLSSSFFLSSAFSSPVVSIYQFAFYFVDFEL